VALAGWLSQSSVNNVRWNHKSPQIERSVSAMTQRTLFAAFLATVLIAPACRLFAADPPINALTDEEKKAGWTLLFDGKTSEGFRSWGRTDLNPGWLVEEGTLCHKVNAGDLSTVKEYGSFEFQMDYKIGKLGNSGVMFHCVETKGANGRVPGAPQSGPEMQLEDNATAADAQKCGWLYDLYKPEIDPKTGKTLDATKPTMEWNHIRLLATPRKGEVEVNGVKYFEFVKGSPDWDARVAKSKFRNTAGFGKATKGYLVFQGDHPGELYMRNMKIREVPAEQ
jgi:hypothetical protein